MRYLDFTLTPRTPRPPLLAALLTTLLLSSPRAADRVLLGLADMRGLGTFRSVRREMADSTHRDVTASGLRAGIDREWDPEDERWEATAQVRAVFKPTLFDPRGLPSDGQVVSVGVLLGGGEATLHRVDRAWGAGTIPEDIFDLPVSDLGDADLVSMFQTVLDSGGRSEVTSGIMLRSEQPLSEHGPFSARFSVTVREGTAWTITGRVRQLQQGRLVEFRSSRRGLATFTINGVEQYVDVPVARDAIYRFSIASGSLQAGANALLVRVTDPEDGTSQELSLTLNA